MGSNPTPGILFFTINKDMKELIKKLENELLQLDVRKSEQRLAKLLADDFLEFGSLGHEYNKRDITELLSKVHESEIIMNDFRVKPLSPDTALALYSTEQINPETGQKKYSLRSSIWRNGQNGWQMIFHQGTPYVQTD